MRRLAGFDPRIWQIGVLAALLAVQLGWLDFGVSGWQAAVTIASTLLTESLACRVLARRLNWRSPLITGLSLSLLLRSYDPAIWALAGVMAIGSKYLIRVGGKHLFNPACFAIVALLPTGYTWVSPGQWGAFAWSALLLSGSGALVLSRAHRVDTAAAFLLGYGGLLLGRCLLLGDPLTIPLHQVQSGALLIFGLFMVTDPRSTPDSRAGRILFAMLVAVTAFVLQFGWQVREGLFFALTLAAPLVPLLDRLARRYPIPETTSCSLAASLSLPPPR